ncbi:MAG: 50S ribosome-binding GTPase, partial [Promicromonosporaceae bacterium]|nr:50S ribosome-binding GTPase [Promicromonosporaceae bacterium]
MNSIRGDAPKGARLGIPADRPDPEAAIELGLSIYDVSRDLRRDVADVFFPLPIAGAAEAQASRDRLLTQLDEHLLPRLRELSAPAIVVIAGSTGAGKSTLYNSVLSEEISAAGVLRPTTREPVMAINPADEELVGDNPAKAVSRLIYREAVPRGTALVDAPDLDSFLEANRATAEKLLEAADLWLFVTTASRYGDALPWQALTRATERGASVAMVLNRVPTESLNTVRSDLLARLREHGMTDVPLFVLPDVGPHEGLLPEFEVSQVRRWLELLGGPERSRAVVVRTLKGALNALPDWVNHLATAIDNQVEAAEAIRACVEGLRLDVEAAARIGIADGALADTTVAARWQQLTSTANIDKVKIAKGIVKSSTRAMRKREEALQILRTDVHEAAVRALVAAGARADDELWAALTSANAPDGAAYVLADDDVRTKARAELATKLVSSWIAHSQTATQMLTAGVGPAAGIEAARVIAAIKAFSEQGLGTLLLASAAGNDDSRLLLARALGDVPEGAVAALREELADRAASMVDAEFQAALAPLMTLALGDEAATGLRVRLVELR